MAIDYRQGDLITLALAGDFDVIAHGCNCFCTMGAGIAKQIRATFPAAYEADCSTPKGDRAKLGTCSVATCSVDTPNLDHVSLAIVNAYTQHHWAGKGVLVDYNAVAGCMAWINAHYAEKRLGLPKIGAGLAGGNWDEIAKILEATLTDMDVTVVTLQI